VNEGSKDNQKKEPKLADRRGAAYDHQANNQSQVLRQLIQHYRSRGRDRTERSTTGEMIFGSAIGFASQDSHSELFRQ
jgi:hypothetical protein